MDYSPRSLVHHAAVEHFERVSRGYYRLAGFPAGRTQTCAHSTLAIAELGFDGGANPDGIAYSRITVGLPEGPFVADHDHVASADLFPLERVQHVLFGVIDARRS